MRKFAFLFIIFAVFCGNAAEPKFYQGKDYQLDYSRSIAVSIRQPDGTFAPFLSRISFDAADKDWNFFFRTGGFRAVETERRPGCDVIRFEYRFTGPQAGRVALTGVIEAYPEWLKISFDGRYRGDMKEIFRQRLIFSYPREELRLLGSAADNGPEGGSCGLRLESDPPLQLSYNRKQKNSSTRLEWPGKDGEHRLNLVLALTPYCGRPPVFSRLSKQPVQARFEFQRYCNVILDGDRREAVFRLLNRIGRPLKLDTRFEIRDHRGGLIASPALKLAAEPGKATEQAVPLPVDRYGYFELRLDLPDAAPLRQSFCILPPTERKFKKGSIFGGILYPWNRKTVEKLDLMEWIGMSMIRRAWPILPEGAAVPALPESGVYTPEQAAAYLREQAVRQLEPVPSAAESLRMPPGTFRLTEAANEVNARRLPVDFAEEMKIEYVKLKQHDPALQVGSSGIAGVDIHWLEEFQQNGAWDYMDALFVHLHCFPRAPEVNNTMTREFWLHDRVTLLRGLMDRFGAKPVYDSENGYLTRYPDRRVEKYPLRSVSESGIAAAFMVRSYLQALAYGLSNKMWFTVDSYGGFGITEYGQPRPAYPAYAAMTRLLDGARYAGELLSPGRISNAMDRDAEFSRSWFGQATPGLEKELLAADRETVESSRNPELKPYVYIRAFRTPENRPLLACWATLYRQKVEAEAIDTPAWQDQKPGTSLLWNGFPAEREPEPLPVRFRVGVPEVEVADLMGNRRKVRTDNGFLTLRLDDYPQFVLGAAPELLREAESFSLNLFPAEFQPNDKWKTLIQALLPAEKKHPARKSVFDKPNLSATLKAGEPYPVHLRLTNLGSETERGTASLRLPENWKCEPQSIPFTIAPGEEKKIVATFHVTPCGESAKAQITGVVASARQGRIADSVMNVGVSSSQNDSRKDMIDKN